MDFAATPPGRVHLTCRHPISTAPRESGLNLLFTFDTTHHALWAEEVALAHGFACELVPAPPAANARCNLALETLPEAVRELEELLTRERVPYRLHPD